MASSYPERKSPEYYFDAFIRVAEAVGKPIETTTRDDIREARKMGLDVVGDASLSTFRKAQRWNMERFRLEVARYARTQQIQGSEPLGPLPTESAQPDVPPPVVDSDWEDTTDVMDSPPSLAQGVYVVTWAQNATPVEENFWASLQHYCEDRNARLLVIQGRYKNPTSHWNQNNEGEEWWAPQIADFAIAHRVALSPELTVYGDIPIQPTAVTPLTGFNRFGRNNAIFGHPKVQLQTVARSAREDARVHFTTGACTIPNYTHSKAGKKAEAHHIFGALIVEITEDSFFVRQVAAEGWTGTFTDLDKVYSPYGVEQAPRPLGLVMGDIHATSTDHDVVAATLLNPDSIAMFLKPEKVIYHDVLDFKARSHHRIHNADDRYASHHKVTSDNVEVECRITVDWLDKSTPEGTQGYVAASNHDEHADRWLREADPRSDPENALFFHKLRAEKLDRFKRDKAWTPAFEICYDWWGEGKIEFLRRNESLKIEGIECNFHGDMGINGSRGSLANFARLGEKVIIGHSHTPGILDGAYQVGCTAKLDQGYNHRPSSWMHAHCLIYADGKRTMLFVKNGKWRSQS